MTDKYFGKSQEQVATASNTQTHRLLRLPQIIGQKETTPEQAKVNRQSGKSPQYPRPKIEPLIPISRAAWWKGVKECKYPQPVKLSSRTTVWKESDILKLINQLDEAC